MPPKSQLLIFKTTVRVETCPSSLEKELTYWGLDSTQRGAIFPTP